jgi:hypothetical protein
LSDENKSITLLTPDPRTSDPFLLTTLATVVALLFLVRSCFSFFSLAGGFALIGLIAWIWASRVDSRLNSATSRRWNQHRATLRQLLKTDDSRFKT